MMTDGAPPTHDQAEFLLAILQCSEDAIIGVCTDGTVVSWNRGAELVYGYSANEMVGESIERLVSASRQRELVGALARVAEGEPVRQETMHVTKSGETIDVAISLSPVRDRNGQVTGASAIARDITEQRWLARTLDSMVDALSAALAEAQEAESRCRRFLADASHQLRRPITGVSAAVESLLLQGTDPRHERLLESVGREASRAAKLVHDLLQMARIDQVRKLDPGPCDIAHLCEEEVERTRALAPELAITVACDVPDPRVELDADVIREVLTNLLDNSRRHARSRIEVTIRRARGLLEIRVGCDGPGLPEGAEDRAFERFASLDRRGGSGLGLPIARALAQAHGGDLTYEDDDFVVRVPWFPSVQADDQPLGLSGVGKEAASGRDSFSTGPPYSERDAGTTP